MQEHEIHRNVYVMYIMYVQSMYMVSGQGLGQVMCMRVLRAVLYDPCLFSKESITTPAATNQYITTYYLSLHAVSRLGRTRGERPNEQERKQEQYEKWTLLFLTD